MRARRPVHCTQLSQVHSISQRRRHTKKHTRQLQPRKPEGRSPQLGVPGQRLARPARSSRVTLRQRIASARTVGLATAAEIGHYECRSEDNRRLRRQQNEPLGAIQPGAARYKRVAFSAAQHVIIVPDVQQHVSRLADGTLVLQCAHNVADITVRE